MAKKIEQAADEAASVGAAAEAPPTLVAMRRDAPLHGGGPTTADVHPDEVDNYLAGGWEIEKS